MILVKLSAQDLKIIQEAKSEAEVRGVQQLVMDRIAAAKLMKEFGKTPTLDKINFRWKEALSVAKEVLGEDVTFPKITDYRWYQRVNGAIMHDGLDEGAVRQLSQYAKENLRMPTKFDFLICMNKRIMDGEFNKPKPADVTKVNQASFGPELPEE